MTRRWSVLILVVLLAAIVPTTTMAADPVEDWTRQFGTGGSDEAYGSAVDTDGNIVVAGGTEGTLPGQTSKGRSDAYVRGYRPDGSVSGTRQFGTTGFDWAFAVAIGRTGRIAVAGATDLGTFPGQDSRGKSDAFIRVYRHEGRVVWTRQFGTPQWDSATGIAVAGRGRIAVLVQTTDRSGHDTRTSVRTHRPDGTVGWTRRFGMRGQLWAYGIAVDGKGRVVVVGQVRGTLLGQTSKGDDDAFVRVYRPDGTIAWTRQFGTSRYDAAGAVAVDGNGRLVVAGSTDGTFPGQASEGDRDAFVRVFRPDGRVAWTHQFGWSGWDSATGIAVDEQGRIAVAGEVSGASGDASDVDAFVRLYRPAGSVAWTVPFGTADEDRATGITLDGNGRVTVVGYTRGSFPARTNAGGWDAFVRSYVEP